MDKGSGGVKSMCDFFCLFGGGVLKLVVFRAEFAVAGVIIFGD